MIAYNCKYTPKELLSLFDECVLINNTADDFDYAGQIMHPNICSHVKAVIEDVKKNEYDRIFLMNCCTSVLRLPDALRSELKLSLSNDQITGYASKDDPFVKLLDLPVDIDECAIERLAKDLIVLTGELENFYEKKFDAEKFISSLENEYLALPNTPFLFLMGARSTPMLLEIVKKIFQAPVIDITCINNGRVVVKDISQDDPLDVIMHKYARGIINQIPCMRMSDIFSRKRLLENSNCQGIIYNTIKFCDYYNFEYHELSKTDIPILKVETDFTTQSEGQLITRLEGFAESIAKKGKNNMEKNIYGKYYAGIDSGSTTTELCIIDKDKKIIKSVMVKTGANAAAGAKKAFDESGIPLSDIISVVATGYGRKNIDSASLDVTEITCHAKGARALYPDVQTIIDIGGQDSKIIYLDEEKNVKNFVMNDKCAAGTGRFLENMAKVLEIDLKTMASVGLEYKDDLTISSMCTVFAESEVISLIAQNRSVPDIVHGLNKSVASKTKSMAHQAKGSNGIMMTGGVANNRGVVSELEKQLETSIFVPDIPEFCGALGAALIAFENDPTN